METVEKLLERVETATLLEDRRDAVKALKSLAKKYRREVSGTGEEVIGGDRHNTRCQAHKLAQWLVCI